MISHELRAALEEWLEKKPNKPLCCWVIHRPGTKSVKLLIKELRLLFSQSGLKLLTPFNIGMLDFNTEIDAGVVAENPNRVEFVKKLLEVQDGS